MTINLLAFGIAKEIMNASSISLDFDDGMTVGDLKKKLMDQYPPLLSLYSFLLAVNNEYASMDYPLQQEDEIAIIPPVSGG